MDVNNKVACECIFGCFPVFSRVVGFIFSNNKNNNNPTTFLVQTTLTSALHLNIGTDIGIWSTKHSIIALHP